MPTYPLTVPAQRVADLVAGLSEVERAELAPFIEEALAREETLDRQQRDTRESLARLEQLATSVARQYAELAYLRVRLEHGVGPSGLPAAQRHRGQS